MARNLSQFVSDLELSFDELPVDDGGAVIWSRVFGAERPLRIEVGVGNSPFLIEVSRRSPDFNYLGFEYSGKRVRKFLKKVEEANLQNIRLLRVDAVPLLGRLFVAGSIDHLYVNHPDPWPKRRHAKKRFVIPSTVELVRRLLAPGGGLSLRTDSPAYAHQMMEVLTACEGLENLAGRGRFAPRPLEPCETPYEVKFLAEGRPIYYLEFRKPERAG